MGYPALTLRRVAWMVCAYVLLLPHVAAARPSLAIDFDGDGRRDQVVLDQREPSIVHVWLSASGTTQLIRARVALMHVAASDLDGDRRPELIARGGDSQIHVWTHKGTRFHSYRRHGVTLPRLEQQNSGGVEDTDGKPTGVIASVPAAPFTVPPGASPRVIPPASCTARGPHTASAPRSFAEIDPFHPRPPPAHAAL